MAAARMQRWALYTRTQSGTAHTGMPTPCHGYPCLIPPRWETRHTPTVFNLAQIAALPVNSMALVTATKADQVLSQVLKTLHKGWPAAVPDELLTYWRKSDELAVEGDTVFWGIRVIIPRELQPKVLSEL